MCQWEDIMTFLGEQAQDLFQSAFKVKWSESLTLCNPMDYTVHGILQARILEWVAFPFYRGSPNLGVESRSPVLLADCLPAESQGKPKTTGVGSISLLQWIFLTQKLNQDLLHCRQILYQLSFQGRCLQGAEYY